MAMIKDKRLFAKRAHHAQPRARATRRQPPAAAARRGRAALRRQGFHVTSIRDIVRAADMLPGSLYYHFATKEDAAARGLRRRRAPDLRARRGARWLAKTDPWARLEAACAAHLAALLEDSDYAQVVIRVRPRRRAGGRRRADRAARRLRASCSPRSSRAAARAAHRPHGAAPDAARRPQLVADLVPRRPRYSPRSIARQFVTLAASSRTVDARFQTWTSAPKCWSPKSASTAMTAAAASSPPTCATPAWK